MQRRLDALSPILSARRTVETAIYLPRDSEYLCERSTIDTVWNRLWRTLYALNVPTDFIDDTKIAAGKLASYKCVLVPLSPYLSEATAARIADFVQAGGSVILWAGSAVYDYQGHIPTDPPGWGLSGLFGAQTLPKKPVSAQLQLRGDFTSEVIDCDTGMLTHRLELKGAKALLGGGDGHVAISRHQSGKGNALITAIDLGELFERTPEKTRTAIGKAIWDLLELCGVRPRVLCQKQGVEAHLLEKDTSAYLVLINHSGEDQEVNATLHPGRPPSLETAYDVLTLDKIAIKKDGDALEAAIPVLRDSVRIIKVVP